MAARKSPLHADPVPPEPPDGPEPLGIPERGGEYFDAVLDDIDLDGADLAHSRFVRCELRRVRLTAAVLRGATLIDVTLDDCELSGAGFHEATLTGWRSAPAARSAPTSRRPRSVTCGSP